MEKTTVKRTNAQPPEKHTGLVRKKLSKSAGGMTAIFSSVRHILREMGPLKGLKVLSKMNQKEGFDCPGCAWPDPDDKRSSLGEFCENGVKAIAEEATNKRIDASFFASYSVEELAALSDFEIGKMGRLVQPVYLKKGATHYEAITWEGAFNKIANQLNELDSPDQAVFYTSGRTSNEAAFLYQLFVRMYGTNNLPDCSNMCHESSGQGLSQTVGIGKGSVTLEDLHEAEVIVVVGQNPGTNHPRMLTALQKCKRNGGKIITINPIPETGLMKFKHPQHVRDLVGGGTLLTDIFLQVKINGDVSLMKAIMCLLLEAEEANPGSVFDREFIEKHTSGYGEFLSDLKGQNYQQLVKASGVSDAEIRKAADLLAKNKKIIICWAMGLTQHENGVENIKEMVNLLLLKGSIGKPGAGACPVRGHSNVQGDRTMGIWEKPPEAFLDRLETHFSFKPPRDHGLDTVHAIKAMHEGKAKVFFAMGGNFISATPDTEYTAQALRNCKLTVQVSTKLNRSHLIHGEEAIILPCLARSEQDIQLGNPQFVSIENSMGVVQSSRGNLKPASGQLKSEPVIIAELAKATLNGAGNIDWDQMVADYDQIRDAIEACIPGFNQYNKRVREPGGFYLPNGARQGKFNTAVGKAIFTVTTPPKWELEEGEYLMMTIRSHDQYNTTIYGLDDRYRGIFNERRVVLMNKTDMVEAGINEKQAVDLISDYEGEKRIAANFIALSYDIPRACTATYFPEANVLVSVNHMAKGSHTPASKSVVIRIDKRE